MDEIIRQANVANSQISEFLRNDQILDASAEFEKLQHLQTLVKTLSNEIELTRLTSQANIVNYLKRLRCNIEILESPLASMDDIQRLSETKIPNHEIVPGISLANHIIPDETFIPDMPLYYISETDEYAIKVNGLLIKGKIHDPEEQGFKSGNWIYTKEPLNLKNKFMRHIGSPKHLKLEILESTTAEKDLRLKQLSHDLLINLAISDQRKSYPIKN